MIVIEAQILHRFHLGGRKDAKGSQHLLRASESLADLISNFVGVHREESMVEELKEVKNQ